MRDCINLPDPVLGQNHSQIYLSVSAGGTDLVTANQYLSSPGGEEARLKRVNRDAATGVFKVVGLVRMRVGWSTPTQGSQDIADICRVLGDACILEE